jgi:hypothetical protein
MNARPSELMLAQMYQAQHSFEGLSREQYHLIMERGRKLYHWYKSHHGVHCLISLSVLSFLFAGDAFVLLYLPELWLVAGASNAVSRQLFAATIVGMLHAWIIYSLGVFTLHEGAAHQSVFPPKGRISRPANFLANNLCRIGGGDPLHYAERHMIHHARFGTEDDAEFLNFITPRRYWRTFLPFAALFNFSDFVAHRPQVFTRSRFVSVVVAGVYHGAYAYSTYRAWGLWFTVAVVIVLLHIGFYLDRLRQFTEHNLMPMDNWNGSRSLGLGLWGNLFGGGPWGNPYHWEHHVVASIPWYQQIILHRFAVRVLTPQQRKQFLLQPIIGFPRLFVRLIRDCNSLIVATETTKSACIQHVIASR